ncbi:hypothetical protein [Schaalia vaccimaxillae]|uniref:hypothetical protein n=1 Tax=Schaalia vaccimaxillae TaxID=183916 RepID=UPI000425FF6D|nr:hypothetical protein [Schaalia vaccimaxillae]
MAEIVIGLLGLIVIILNVSFVPDLSGMTLREAYNVIEKKELNVLVDPAHAHRDPDFWMINYQSVKPWSIVFEFTEIKVSCGLLL